MKKRIILALAMILVLLMAGSAPAAAAGAEVPFVTYVMVVPGAPTPIIENGQMVGFTITPHGGGDVMHLGASAWNANMSVRFGVPYLTLQADMTFTAANGDTLTGSYSGSGQLEGGFNHGWGTFAITGGTGRFAGASGGGSIDCWHPLDGSPGPVYFSGTLIKAVE